MPVISQCDLTLSQRRSFITAAILSTEDVGNFFIYFGGHKAPGRHEPENADALYGVKIALRDCLWTMIIVDSNPVIPKLMRNTIIEPTRLFHTLRAKPATCT